MKIFDRITEVNIEHISENSVWSMESTEIHFTIFGIKVWKINRKVRALRYGKPYIATL